MTRVHDRPHQQRAPRVKTPEDPRPRPSRKPHRELAALLATDGWTYAGIAAGGHLRFVHLAGVTMTVSATSSDHRARRNMVADGRRLIRGVLEAEGAP